jgi:hypothetical protein
MWRAALSQADADGVMHFPGSHPEAAAFLLEEKQRPRSPSTRSRSTAAVRPISHAYSGSAAAAGGVECVANSQHCRRPGPLVVGAPRSGRDGGIGRVIAWSDPGAARGLSARQAPASSAIGKKKSCWPSDLVLGDGRLALVGD